jgi:hypothetical protein
LQGGFEVSDSYQLARAGEAKEDLRLAIKAQYETHNMNHYAWREIQGAYEALAEALEKLGGS